MGHHTPERFDSLSFMIRFLLRFWKAAWAQSFCLCATTFYFIAYKANETVKGSSSSRACLSSYKIGVAGNWLCLSCWTDLVWLYFCGANLKGKFNPCGRWKLLGASFSVALSFGTVRKLTLHEVPHPYHGSKQDAQFWFKPASHDGNLASLRSIILTLPSWPIRCKTEC